jgi:choice-of-anchor B domain-containing protein
VSVGRSRAWAAPLGGLVLLALPAASHDDTRGARFVDAEGANASDCLEHHEPCRSIEYALDVALPGNTIKVSEGVYDVTGIEPERFLFGTIHAQGGYEPAGHFDIQDPEAYPTILVGVDPRYRQALMRLGFEWAASIEDAREGIVDDSPAPALQATALAAEDCVQGAAGQFPCRNVDLLAQIALDEFSTQPVSAANVWGLVDLNDAREYAIVGLSNGTAVVDVTDPEDPREVVTIPGNPSPWREVKVYQYFDGGSNRYRAYAYVTTEASGSGLQVIDLSGLPATATLASTLFDTGSQHTDYISNIDYATNVVLPGAEAFLYVAGSDLAGGAWRVYGLADPAQPQFIAAAPTGSEYVHDATSLLITDERAAQCGAGHDPCEVYVDFNTNSVDLWDVTDKGAPVMLSSTTYSDASYTHSGWPSADQRRIFVHDETEEIFDGLNTQIYTMDVDDLLNPFIVASYQGPGTATDHNGYVKGGFLYVSHYRRGLVVFDASEPEQLREVASFDTFLQPAADSAGTDGAWGVYPFFPSGTVVVSDISNGLFVLRDGAATLGQNAGRIGFSSTTVQAGEGGANAGVVVRRNAGTAGAVSVEYSTSDLDAAAGSDYTAATGTLEWPAGDMDDRTITIPLVDDDDEEGEEAFRVTLANPGGGASLEGSASIDVTIDDGASVGPPPGGGGGGGGSGLELLALLTLLFLLAQTQQQAHRRAHDRADQVRLRNDRDA